MTDYDVTVDEDLSALLDGELTPERASELRERIAAEPALAARLVALERVDGALRALPAEAPARLRAALHEKLERAKLEEASRPSRGDAPRRAGDRRLAAGWVGAVFAAAAALALYWTVSNESDPVLEPDPAEVYDSLANATDEEIGIATLYETLADLDVIEDLELLELMVELEEEEAERG